MHRFPRRSIASLLQLGGARCPYSSATVSSSRTLPRPVEDRGDKTRSPVFASSHCNCSTFYKSFSCRRDFSGVRYISTASVSDSSSAPCDRYDHQAEEPLDPFSLVADELSVVADRLRSMVVAEVPKLASAAEYYFKEGAEGKKFRPTVLLLMATAINSPISRPRLDPPIDTLSLDLRTRQQCIAAITEMIHVASLLHDDVLDDADTRRGVASLNFEMGNKLAVLGGDFLLSRACIALASLKNTEVVTLLATVVGHLVTGETMQMTTSSDDRCSMEYYMQKTYYKAASLISNSCKAIALLAGQTTEVAMLAYDYGKNLGLAFQLIDDVLDFTGTLDTLGKASLSDIRHGIITAPILFAMEEFPQLRSVVDKGLDNPSNEELVLEYLKKSRGIERTKELAGKHASLATAAIDSLPDTDDENVLKSRRALVELAERPVERKPGKFNPLVIPKSLQAKIPFASKPKDIPSRRWPLYESRRTFVMEPLEHKVNALVKHP